MLSGIKRIAIRCGNRIKQMTFVLELSRQQIDAVLKAYETLMGLR